MDLNLVRIYFDYHPDGYLINKITRGRTAKAGSRTCKENTKSYRQVKFFGRVLREHVLIWIWHHLEWPENIDHIDHDRLNNKIENLRNVSHKVNIRHGNGKQNGVYEDKRTGHWIASIHVDNKKIHLGCFKEYKDALAKRLEGEKELWPDNV